MSKLSREAIREMLKTLYRSVSIAYCYFVVDIIFLTFVRYYRNP